MVVGTQERREPVPFERKRRELTQRGDASDAKISISWKNNDSFWLVDRPCRSQEERRADELCAEPRNDASRRFRRVPRERLEIHAAPLQRGWTRRARFRRNFAGKEANARWRKNFTAQRHTRFSFQLPPARNIFANVSRFGTQVLARAAR